LTPWGVSARVPQAVDWSLNARMWGLLQGESEGCVLHDALRLLSRGMLVATTATAATATASVAVRHSGSSTDTH
jgi:hypothetical protein